MIDDLNLDIGWRVGEQNFREIVDQIEKVEPNVIVEFGAGASSIRLSKAFKKAQIYSIDHDLDYFNQAEFLSHTHNAKNLHLIYCSLRWQTHGMSIYESYSRADLPNIIDAVVIDGPPHFTFNGREACLYQVYENLRIGGVVLLDDFDRSIEQRHVEQWLAKYPGSFQQSSGGKNSSVCILKKMKDVPPRLNWGLIINSYSQLMRRMYDGENILRIRKIYVSLKNWLKHPFG